MIQELTIQCESRSLNGKYTFHNDINIFTGRNGCGKTTILKVIWYLISGNIERAITEIEFESCKLITDKYTITLELSKGKENQPNFYQIELLDPSGHSIFADKITTSGEARELKKYNNETVTKIPSSVFFPTFRRIEGGFNIGDLATAKDQNYFLFGQNKLSDALKAVSDSMSVDSHKFVTSVSTADVSQLITTNYARASSKTDEKYKTFHGKINALLDRKKNSANQSKNSDQILKDVEETVIKFNNERIDLFKQFLTLDELVMEVFQKKGIKFGKGLIFGDSKSVFDSEKLSAGEKQMLSFLSYNTFIDNCPYFIDEPELSLHVDWQRRIVNILAAQQTGNQFFIATHSPFIYGQFPEKEIEISEDRGE